MTSVVRCPPLDGRPPLFMIGQPMDASGFNTLASHFLDPAVVTYDPRGLGRSVRKDGRVDNAPMVQADDVRAILEALGAGPVEMFASSGGAVTALALVAAYPDDVTTLVAHEPPLIPRAPRRGCGRACTRRHSRRVRGKGLRLRHGDLHRDDVVARRVHRRVLRASCAGSHPLRHAGRRRRASATTRSYPTGPGQSSSYRPDVAALAAAPNPRRYSP